MGSLMVSAAALVITFLLALLCGVSSVLGQELREGDALCNADGCFVVYLQRKTFLESWKACRAKGGNLATIKRKEDATSISTLFSTLDLRHSRTKVQVWIGLQRQPRQCSSHLLRGFSWTTGDQDTQYSNWQEEESPLCSVPRCVVMGYSTQELNDNLKWMDVFCSDPVDGYLCHYAYKGMCPALWSEGAGNALYTTPFNLVSALLTHVPFGSVATVPCPAGTNEEQSVSCIVKEDGSVGWSKDSPLCSESPASYWCDQDNGGCEHFCRTDGTHFYCECDSGYQLGVDGQSCELSDVCQEAPCQFECLPLSDGYRCACPEGYMLLPDEHGCVDIDECLQSPCEQLCTNFPGTFECGCLEGYDLDEDGGCEDIDECINVTCEHECENILGSHICHCNLGFSPVPENPSQCQDTDECQIPGTCQHMCANHIGGFVCYCEEGYELMPDNSSCQKREEGEDRSFVTPQVWNPVVSKWYLQTQTEWPQEEVQEKWPTDPVVIWVTSAPQEPLPLGTPLDPLTQEPENDGKDTDNGGTEWLIFGQRPESGMDIPKNNIYTTSPATTSSSTTPDLFEDDKEETTTALPFLSTISKGAWNLRSEVTSYKPNNPTTDHNVLTDFAHHNEGPPEQDLFMENTHLPGEYGNKEITQSLSPAGERLAPSQPPLSKGGENLDILDSVQEDRGQNKISTWLLVGLLVPICIIIVVMVALGIVYCTRCAIQPRDKNATDCYHWISGAHDKQGASNPSAGVKTHV
ncbi:Endosialin Tumor endothelial marker 1 Precursor [Channa argus]|uniref:Endosialin Tumor endothelial marker 1 n=1 Tax=Channa argus TaxID=215402 RepID=A0A6G1Q4K0_CHAAH|nr:Endosialin Tumor endothelial marker 1 Precursor [Channa argus]KAK2900294.1 hypothetical protein Q8A73_013423 [Channa argus]